MNAPSIAIVGLACLYPDARTPGELWENVLAQRRAFRTLPPERFRREDYWSADRLAPDATYACEGAVIEGHEFDRVAFRVVGSTFRSADLAHWLALDVAARSLADAGFAEGQGLPRTATGVLVGNTLTGEFSRANSLRLRWPYVRRVVEAALAKEGWKPDARRGFLDRLEADYKSPFPPVGEETLAGGLSNTIAGRICNQFDLRGGGYTVDGACAASLLAVANACSSLADGDLDVALAGGVDLSLDPFEMVGFAKIGALAADEMRVFDRRSAGFWPGEGCGFVVLMRHEDALAQGRRVYAVIRGWGISSDGNGGLTRPEAEGQIEALRRAYRRAGFGPDTVTYCEAHGTGTIVGDATELEVLSRARREAKPGAPLATIGSIKANIGHCKAAAGIAGLIKATMAVHTQVLPPTTGCEQPHPQLLGPAPALRVLREPELWPRERPLRASVSAMGFGGINAHLVLEGVVAERRASFSAREQSLSRSSQDAELFLLASDRADLLLRRVDQLRNYAARLSHAELTDLAAELARTLQPGPVRAAVVASKPAELGERLQTLASWLQSGVVSRVEPAAGVFLGSGETPPRIAFLFPGQGSPTHLEGGRWRHRFDAVRQLYARAELPAESDSVSTRVMQPAVVTASLAGLKVLDHFGVVASAALGHSLGEFTALHWAGVFEEETLLRIVRVRGAAMAELGSATGAMIALAAPWQKVQPLLDGDALTIVGFNSPQQTVVAGETAAINNLARRAAAHGRQASLLRVSHAFHTPLVAAAVPVLADQLSREQFLAPKRPVVSTVTGALLEASEDLRALLCRQVTSPVRFNGALMALLGLNGDSAADGSERLAPLAASDVDLMIEVGPGSVLSGLVRDTTAVPVVAMDAGGASLKGLLHALGSAFVLGAPLQPAALFADRFSRPFALDWKPRFFVNPCELAPISDDSTYGSLPVAASEARALSAQEEPLIEQTASSAALTPLAWIRQLVAERAELPVEAVRPDHRMLSDLHLNSITVGQLISEAAKGLSLPRVAGLTDFANASVAEIAQALEELKASGQTTRRDEKRQLPAGVGSWVRAFTIDLVATEPTARAAAKPGGEAAFRADPGGPHPGAAVAWQVFAPAGHPWAEPLKNALPRVGVSGVLVCLPENPTTDDLALLLRAGQAVLAMKSQPRFVVAQHGWGGSGFARSLHLERPSLITCVVNVPPEHPQAVEWILAETQAAAGFVEAHYTPDGQRLEPRLKLAEFSDAHRPERPQPDNGQGESAPCSRAFQSGLASAAPPLSRTDVLLVTGGGKGIAAECALKLARETGVRLALMGRSDPATDPELAKNLERIAAADVSCGYFRADVTDADSVRSAVGELEQKLGPVTAILHGAGVNTPQLITGLDEAAFQRTVRPKVEGARHVLEAVDAERLRLLVTFGSIISRTGLPGEADYATANEWLRVLTQEFQRKHPHCRCLALEWSVWSGVGMGERLGRLETLVQQGIMPITPDDGVRILCELLRRPAPAAALVVTGRFGEPPTLQFAESELPLQRFLERKRVHYPGVELVVDAELSLQADPYLADHVVQKERLFPAVLGLEAMVQTAMALAASTDLPVVETLELARPVVVSDHASLTIRLAALQHRPGEVEVCLRSEETDFQVDHFRVVCRFNGAAAPESPRLALSPFESDQLALDPPADLYGRILFHRGRFCRLRRYRLLKAKQCVAEIAPNDSATWFGPYLPSQFVLGDPAARDAALHAIQACIPHWRILPTAIDRLVVRRSESGPRFVRALERVREGHHFVYDLEITDASGEVIERWDGLHLRAVEMISAREVWPEPLLGPYLERRLEELVSGSPVRLALERGLREERSGDTERVIRQALGKAERIWRRPDGKPVVFGPESVSAAHCRDLTLAVVGGGGVACDLEEVTARSEQVWRELLGEEGFGLAHSIARERSESTDIAATRLWTAVECLKKAGLPVRSSFVLESITPDGWVVLRSGALVVATWVAAVRGMKHPLAIAAAVHSKPGPGQRLAAVEAVA